jgi:hypothetical protein
MEPRDRVRISSLRPNFPALLVLFVLWLIWAPFLDKLPSFVVSVLSLAAYPLFIIGVFICAFCVVAGFGIALAIIPLLLGGGIPKIR